MLWIPVPEFGLKIKPRKATDCFVSRKPTLPPPVILGRLGLLHSYGHRPTIP